ncbi:MAG: hypothetical protein E6H53_19695 [Betaproteobacteria bacterium]|nr:MAG: hypothetical protein E6H53_19695 [Betaproteobacteria bacterium]
MATAMARRMPPDVAVFGIAPRCIARVPLAHARIEDMAAFYVEQVRNKQAHGPYLLGGMCAGAVIAYEMASQLTRAGERVDLVALLDAATPQAKKRARIAKQRLGRLSQALADARGAEGVLVERVRAAVQITSRKLVNALSWEATRRARGSGCFENCSRAKNHGRHSFRRSAYARLTIPRRRATCRGRSPTRGSCSCARAPAKQPIRLIARFTSMAF